MEGRETIVLWDGSNAGEILRARKGMLASTMMRVCHNEEFIPDYFFYALKSWEDYLKAQTSGSGIPHVDKEILGNIRLFNCIKSEQAKIAEVLTTVDQVIEQTEALIAKQQRMKNGLMKDLLTHGIDKVGKIRSEETHEFKDSSLGRIPMDWDVKTLGEMSKSGAQNGFFKKPELVGSGFKLINVSELYQPFGINTEITNVERVRASDKDLVKFSVQEGDIFFTRSSLVLSGIAHCNIIRKVRETTLFECHVMRVQVDINKVVPEFMALFCQSNKARLFLMSRAKHVTMATISQPEIEDLPVLVPRMLGEQRAIAEAILSSEQTIRSYEKNKNKLYLLKTGLMQDLLTGKVPVTPLLNKAETAA